MPGRMYQSAAAVPRAASSSVYFALSGSSNASRDRPANSDQGCSAPQVTPSPSNPALHVHECAPGPVR